MSFDEDGIGSLQTGSSAMNMSSSAEEDCERRGQVAPRNTRIGRASPVLKRVCNSPHPSNPTDWEQISYQMMTYPLVYMLIWTIPTTIRIYQATTGKSALFAIGTVDKVGCVPSSCLIQINWNSLASLSKALQTPWFMASTKIRGCSGVESSGGGILAAMRINNLDLVLCIQRVSMKCGGCTPVLT
jgi:hypothetical protein